MDSVFIPAFARVPYSLSHQRRIELSLSILSRVLQDVLLEIGTFLGEDVLLFFLIREDWMNEM